ncbi:MAG: TonB-dependent receptor, partial [Thiohalomonadaceae bacterium]
DAADTSISIITPEEIAREHPPDVLTLLRARVGLDYSSGTLTMRGVQGIAVFVDGFASSADELTRIKPQLIDQIAILRGAASARYGAGAMGGAILVTTRKHFARTEIELMQAMKSNGSITTRFSGTRSDGAMSFGALGEYRDNRGHRAVPDAPFPGQITVEDEDGRSYNLDLKIGFHGSDLETDFNINHSWMKDNYGRPNWWWEQANTTVRLTSNIKNVRACDYRLSLGYEEVDDDALRDRGTGIDAAGLAADRHIFSDNASWEAEVAMARKFEGGALDFAVTAKYMDIAHSIKDFATGEAEFALESKTSNTAALFHYQGKLADNLQMELGGRYDRFYYYDTTIFDALLMAPIHGDPITKEAFNPRLGLRWQADAHTLLSTNVGTGFVPPDPEQLYYEDLGDGAQFLANPGLEPERSWTWDLGLQQNLAGARLGVSLFYTQWENKLGVLIIDYGDPVKRQWNNIGTAEAKGVEFDLDQPLGKKWQLSFNYTYNHTQITQHEADPSLVGNELPYMPPHKANVALAYNGSAFNARAAVRYVGDTYTNERNTELDADGFDWRQDDYTVVDLTVVKPLGDGRLTLAVDNLFDERYVSGFFRESAGRVIRGEWVWRF